MVRKHDRLLLVPVVLTMIFAVLISGCIGQSSDENHSNDHTEPIIKTPPALACYEHDGSYRLIIESNGTEAGSCTLPDGSVCTDDEFYREMCYEEQNPVYRFEHLEKNEFGYYEIDMEIALGMITFNTNITDLNVIVLDVSNTYDMGHIEGAINIYYTELEDKIDELDPKRPYIVYSQFKSNTQEAAKTLVSNGFDRVYALDVDFDQWAGFGYPTSLYYCYLTNMSSGHEDEYGLHNHVWCADDKLTRYFCREPGNNDCHRHAVNLESKMTTMSDRFSHKHELAE